MVPHSLLCDSIAIFFFLHAPVFNGPFLSIYICVCGKTYPRRPNSTPTAPCHPPACLPACAGSLISASISVIRLILKATPPSNAADRFNPPPRVVWSLTCENWTPRANPPTAEIHPPEQTHPPEIITRPRVSNLKKSYEILGTLWNPMKSDEILWNLKKSKEILEILRNPGDHLKSNEILWTPRQSEEIQWNPMKLYQSYGIANRFTASWYHLQRLVCGNAPQTRAAQTYENSMEIWRSCKNIYIDIYIYI